MECNSDMNVMKCWNMFVIAKCIVNIKDWLEELKPYEEFVEVQTLTANVDETANRIGRNGLEPIELSESQKLLELQDEDLTGIELKEMLNSNTY